MGVGQRLEVGFPGAARPTAVLGGLTRLAFEPDRALDARPGARRRLAQIERRSGAQNLAQIVDSRTIRPSGGNANLGIKDPRIDMLLDEAVRTADPVAREKRWTDIDRLVMEEARALPGIWAKGLYYRPPYLTNMFITDGFQMYDYLAIGTTRR